MLRAAAPPNRRRDVHVFTFPTPPAEGRPAVTNGNESAARRAMSPRSTRHRQRAAPQ